jgi:hypothetical protein
VQRLAETLVVRTADLDGSVLDLLDRDGRGHHVAELALGALTVTA